MVRRAQEKLENEFRIGQLRDQVMEMIARTREAALERFSQPERAQVLVS